MEPLMTHAGSASMLNGQVWGGGNTAFLVEFIADLEGSVKSTPQRIRLLPAGEAAE